MLRNWSGVGKVLLTFLALVHMLNATQLVWGRGGFDNLPCAWTHVKCYATGLEFVKKDKKPAKGQRKLLGTQKIDRRWQDGNRFLRTQCFFKEHREKSESSIENMPTMPTCSGEMRRMYGMRLDNCANDEQEKTKKKRADLHAFQKIDTALWRNAGLDSKRCILQHFGFPPFSSITSKYCKSCKFHKKKEISKRSRDP